LRRFAAGKNHASRNSGGVAASSALAFPQWLKPGTSSLLGDTTEVVPFPVRLISPAKTPVSFRRIAAGDGVQ
jgi:hypothetical protein